MRLVHTPAVPDIPQHIREGAHTQKTIATRENATLRLNCAPVVSDVRQYLCIPVIGKYVLLLSPFCLVWPTL